MEITNGGPKVTSGARDASDYTPEQKAELGRFRSAESKAKALANLRPPWTPGHVPKGGRPKTNTILLSEVRRQLRQKFAGDPQGRTTAALVVRALIVKALRGDVWACRLLFEANGGIPTPELLQAPPQVNVMVIRNQERDFSEPDIAPTIHVPALPS